MYQVLKPLQGYGYLVGDVTDKISEEDAKKFLKAKFITKVEKPTKKSK